MSWWICSDAERDEIMSKWQIPYWPAPNTVRIEPFLRMLNMRPNCNPVSARIFVEIQPVQVPDDKFRAIVNIDNFAENDCWGITDEDADGRQMKVSIRSDDDFVDNQGVHHSGMVYAFEYSRTGFDWKRLSFLDGKEGNTSQPQLTPPFFHSPLFPRFVALLDEQGGPNPDWGPVQEIQFRCSTVSECYDPPGAELGPIGGFAEFNGIDSYIELDHITTNTRQAFSCSADIRVHDGAVVPIFGHNTSARIFGPEADDLRWVSRDFAVGGFPPLNTWFNLRLELEWTDPTTLTWATFIDDVEVLKVARSRTTPGFHNLGVKQFGGIPTWGHFDMKNLLYLTGSPASPVVQLDMPLQVNALDLGPDANHGTTFNMALPSV